MDKLYKNPNNKFKTEFIMSLNKLEQNKIRNTLIKRGIINEDLRRAMAGRVCDLEDTIPIYRILRSSRNIERSLL